MSAVQLGFIVGMLLASFLRVAGPPLFSTLMAQRAPAGTAGTALTLVACGGVALAIVSLQVFGAVQAWVAAPHVFWMLVPGPLLGLLATRAQLDSAILLNLTPVKSPSLRL